MIRFVMTTLFLISLSFIATAAPKEKPADAPVPAPPAELIAKVTPQEAQLILNALSAGQWREVNALISKLSVQFKEQQTPVKNQP